jgi:hypothetical protein
MKVLLLNPCWKNNLQLHYTPLVKTQEAAVGTYDGKKKNIIS